MPWWVLPPSDDGADDPVVLGEPGPDKVRVVSKRDALGFVVEVVWCRPEHAWQWEEWAETPSGSRPRW